MCNSLNNGSILSYDDFNDTPNMCVLIGHITLYMLKLLHNFIVCLSMFGNMWYQGELVVSTIPLSLSYNSPRVPRACTTWRFPYYVDTSLSMSHGRHVPFGMSYLKKIRSTRHQVLNYLLNLWEKFIHKLLVNFSLTTIPKFNFQYRINTQYTGMYKLHIVQCFHN